jgi:hypothetical protein
VQGGEDAEEILVESATGRRRSQVGELLGPPIRRGPRTAPMSDVTDDGGDPIPAVEEGGRVLDPAER